MNWSSEIGFHNFAVVGEPEGLGPPGLVVAELESARRPSKTAVVKSMDLLKGSGSLHIDFISRELGLVSSVANHVYL